MNPPTPESSPELSLQDKLERLYYYRREDAQEWNLLSNRVSAYITSQSFLVSAYAISMGNQNKDWGDAFTLWFPLIVAAVGILASWNAYPGIKGASDILFLWHKKQRRLFYKNPDAPVLEQDERMADFYDGRVWSDPKPHHWGIRRKPKNPQTESVAEWSESKSVDEIHEKSLRFAKTSPWLFGVAWFVLIALVFYLHFFVPKAAPQASAPGKPQSRQQSPPG